MKILYWIDEHIGGKFSAFALFVMFAFVLLLCVHVLTLGIRLTNYDYVTIVSDIADKEETVMLEVAKKSHCRPPGASDKITMFPPPLKYMITFKSGDEAYNGKTVSVSKESYEKYEIGKSYEFRIKTITTRQKRIIPV